MQGFRFYQQKFYLLRLPPSIPILDKCEIEYKNFISQSRNIKTGIRDWGFGVSGMRNAGYCRKNGNPGIGD